jgi:hypothetical protein
MTQSPWDIFRSVLIRFVVLCIAILSRGPHGSDAWVLPSVRPQFCEYGMTSSCARSQSELHYGVAASRGVALRVKNTRGPVCALGNGVAKGDVPSASALDALIEKARYVAKESWRLQESRGEGASRSASGGTSWADGSWLDSALEQELISTMNSTRHYQPVFSWLKAAPNPTCIELWESPEATVVLHLIPAAMTMALPWLHPTGSKVLCRTLFGRLEVVQLLGDPHGRRPMREATRLQASPDKVLAYMGGPPRIYGSSLMTQGELTAVLEVALHSKGFMERSKRGFIPDAVGYEQVGPPAMLTLPPTFSPSLLVSADHPPRHLHPSFSPLALPPSSPDAAAQQTEEDVELEQRYLDEQAQRPEDADDLDTIDLAMFQAPPTPHTPQSSNPKP